MRDAIRQAVAGHRPVELPLEGHTAAAVMLLLYEERGVEHVLLQVRTARVEHHAGEIGFPGGRHDPGDASLLHTALRETHEEIGLAPHELEIFGQLDDTVVLSSNHLMRPYVGAVLGAPLGNARGAPREFATAAAEVHELLRVPLEHLRSPHARGEFPVNRSGEIALMPAYRYGEHVIWGATYRVLNQFLELYEAARA
ncbi:MAG: CoA pyrophosphatase [Dehalococcoidia bacterium]|nr:CoA pyrophosphatase [Dehalococcoidia bacterium]